MYSLLADFLVRLKYLRFGLAMVLVFVGTKMLIAPLYEVPITVSLPAVATLLGGSAAASLINPACVRWHTGVRNVRRTECEGFLSNGR
jgi:predicted tellurium resistance membrane protein TerC